MGRLHSWSLHHTVASSLPGTYKSKGFPGMCSFTFAISRKLIYHTHAFTCWLIWRTRNTKQQLQLQSEDMYLKVKKILYNKACAIIYNKHCPSLHRDHKRNLPWSPAPSYGCQYWRISPITTWRIPRGFYKSFCFSCWWRWPRMTPP